jgi:biotin transport system permease protein
MLSFYIARDSPVHRLPGWAKLIMLCLAGVAVMVITSPAVLGASLALILAGYVLARLPAGPVWRMTRAVLVLVALIAAAQWWFSSATTAAVVALRILCLVAAANLLTMTTRTSDLIGAVEALLSPLARLGLRPERAGIAISLALRFIPVLVEQGTRVRQAQAARGVRAPLTWLVPLVIRTVRLADGVGEALEVRGWGRAVPPSPTRATRELP